MFPVKDSVHISIIYKLQDISQVELIKYVIVIYNESHNWWLHIEHVVTKGVRVMGILHKLSNCRSEMRREALLLVYKMYVRRVLEFGCLLFSGASAYKLQLLVLLEQEAIWPCLGLPKYLANTVSYLEA